APAQLQCVAEAAGGEEPNLCHLALEHGVGGGRGAVDDEVEMAGRHASLGDRRQHAVGLVGGSGGDLGQSDAAALAPRLEEQEVRERPADVDASYPPHARKGPLKHAMSLAYKQSRCCPGARVGVSDSRTSWVRLAGRLPAKYASVRAEPELATAGQGDPVISVAVSKGERVPSHPEIDLAQGRVGNDVGHASLVADGALLDDVGAVG